MTHVLQQIHAYQAMKAKKVQHGINNIIDELKDTRNGLIQKRATLSGSLDFIQKMIEEYKSEQQGE